MAHAYETIAHGGQARRAARWPQTGRPSASRKSPPASHLPDGSHVDVNRVEERGAAAVDRRNGDNDARDGVKYGTGRGAAIGQFAAGKTGTTSNFGDAWFVGWDSKYTVAVWVGYPNKLIPMTTDYDGGPVLGGTFPALIWHDFMISAMQLEKTEAEDTRPLRSEPRAPGRPAGGRSRRRAEGPRAHRRGRRPPRRAPRAAEGDEPPPASPSAGGEPLRRRDPAARTRTAAARRRRRRRQQPGKRLRAAQRRLPAVSPTASGSARAAEAGARGRGRETLRLAERRRSARAARRRG